MALKFNFKLLGLIIVVLIADHVMAAPSCKALFVSSLRPVSKSENITPKTTTVVAAPKTMSQLRLVDDIEAVYAKIANDGKTAEQHKSDISKIIDLTSQLLTDKNIPHEVAPPSWRSPKIYIKAPPQLTAETPLLNRLAYHMERRFGVRLTFQPEGLL